MESMKSKQLAHNKCLINGNSFVVIVNIFHSNLPVHNKAMYRKDEDTVPVFKELSGLIQEMKRHTD